MWVWHKAFLRWVRAQGYGPDMPGISKNASGLVGITLKKGYLKRQAIILAFPERVRAWWIPPPPPEEWRSQRAWNGFRFPVAMSGGLDRRSKTMRPSRSSQSQTCSLLRTWRLPFNIVGGRVHLISLEEVCLFVLATLPNHAMKCLSSYELNPANQVQILDKVVCVSLFVNTFEKGMDLSLLLLGK